jgi:ABC-type transport system involved in multi-copper enzyme maturation permease subunit
MTVHERSFKSYSGQLTPGWRRFLVLPFYALPQIFKSRLFLSLYLISLVPSVVQAALIYIRHNLRILEYFHMTPGDLGPISGEFFLRFISIQGGFCFALVLVAGPPLISSDLVNRGLPLYFARPLGRGEYVLGKLSVLVILLSPVTWIPQLLIFFMQSYLAGNGWFGDNLRIGVGILIGQAAWILTISLIALAVSATVKRKTMARLLFFSIFFIFSIFGSIIAEGMGLVWGQALNIMGMAWLVNSGLLGVAIPPHAHFPPIWAGWLTLTVACAVSLRLLASKIQAYEVVRG